MRWSLRTQVVALVGLVLLLGMGVYVQLATRVVRADKQATVYDVSALVASTVAEQIFRTVDGIAAKLRYFGEEYESTPGDAERRARSLLMADEAVLSLEGEGEGEEEQSGEPKQPGRAGRARAGDAVVANLPEGTRRWAEFHVHDRRQPGCRSPSRPTASRHNDRES